MALHKSIVSLYRVRTLTKNTYLHAVHIRKSNWPILGPWKGWTIQSGRTTEHERQTNKRNKAWKHQLGIPLPKWTSCMHRGWTNRKKQRHLAWETQKERTPRSMGVPVCQPTSKNEHSGRRGIENIQKSNATEHEKRKTKRAPRSMGVPVCQLMSKTSILAVEGLKK